MMACFHIAGMDWSKLSEFGEIGIIIGIAAVVGPLIIMKRGEAADKKTREALPRLIGVATRLTERKGGNVLHIEEGVALMRRGVSMPKHNYICRFEVEYPSQKGNWYMVIKEDQPVQWIWSDPDTQSSIPDDRMLAVADHKMQSITGDRVTAWAIGIALVLIAAVVFTILIAS